MKSSAIPKRTVEQRAEEEAIRRQHASNPIRQQSASAINQQSFTAILSLMARMKALRESQGLTLAEVAERMGIDAPALSRLETGKTLNPTLATLHKWTEALGQKLDVRLSDIVEPLKVTLLQKHEEWRTALTADDPNSIKNQLTNMTWDVAAYRIVIEARTLAPKAKDGGVQLNGLVHNLIDRGFHSSLALAVRRLVDGSSLSGNKGVYSLLGLLDDMRKHSELFTRAAMLEAEDVPYDFEHCEKEDRSSMDEQFAAGKKAYHSPNTNNWYWSKYRHEMIDRLTNTDAKSRKPKDAIPKEKFEIFKERIKFSSEKIKKYVDKFIAHAATRESRADVEFHRPSLDELWDAHETLYRAAVCLVTEFLGCSFSEPLPIPQFDQFAFIDNPLVKTKDVANLRSKWESFARETEKWIHYDLDEGAKDKIEMEYDAFLAEHLNKEIFGT